MFLCRVGVLDTCNTVPAGVAFLPYSTFDLEALLISEYADDLAREMGAYYDDHAP